MSFASIGINGVVACETCRCLVVDGWQSRHTATHKASSGTVTTLEVRHPDSPGQDVEVISRMLYARLAAR